MVMGGVSATAGASAAGLPYAGVPEEMRARVEDLVRSEPAREPSRIVFQQRPGPVPRLSIAGLVRRHGRAALAALGLVVVETVSLQVGPLLTQLGIDDGIVPGRFAIVALVAGIYVASVLVGATASMLRVRWTGRISAWVMNDLRITIFAHLQRLSLDFFTDEKAGVIMTRMTSDIETLQQLLQDGFAQFFVQLLTMVVIAGVLFAYNVRLALITLLIVIPVLTALSVWFRRVSDVGYIRVRDAIARVLADLAENLHGMRVVVAHNRQSHDVVRHRNVLGDYRAANNYTAQAGALYNGGAGLVGLVGQGVLLLIGGRMVLHHQLTIGQLTAFVLYLGAFFQPIQQLTQLYNTYQASRAAVIKLGDLLATEPSVMEAQAPVELAEISGEIVFEDVSFGYTPEVAVIEHVSLRIAAGETVAFVGPTGAGKSTIAKLITRFYDPTEGRITIDGQDLRSVSIRSLRRQLGVVPQEAFLFAGSIRDNIAFARPSATDAEVWRAIRAVGLQELVERSAEGLDAPVHERGQSLSSGERQLIALARAFLVGPRVLVLDEATSNLDLASEMRVEAALDVVLEQRTAILIAHRLSTAMRADWIAVVDGGAIVEAGSHAQLLARGGTYASMYATWMRPDGATS